MKNVLMGLLVKWIRLRKESLSQKIYRYKPANVKKQRQQRMKKQDEQNVQGLWDNNKKYNIHVMGKPNRKEREKEAEVLEAIMPKNFPKLMSVTKPQIQEGKTRPSRIN